MSAAQTYTVDYAGMVQRVADYGVLGAEDGLEEAGIGVEAGGVEDRVLCAHELGDVLLESLVDVLGAADKSDGGHPKAMSTQTVGHGLLNLGAVREPKIVAGAENDGLALVGIDLGTLRGVDDLLTLEQAALANVLQLLFKPGLHFGICHLDLTP